jgi:hypothetical protein
VSRGFRPKPLLVAPPFELRARVERVEIWRGGVV